MPDKKTPSRPVYNYEQNGGKQGRDKPTRPVYDYNNNVRKQNANRAKGETEKTQQSPKQSPNHTNNVSANNQKSTTSPYKKQQNTFYDEPIISRRNTQNPQHEYNRQQIENNQSAYNKENVPPRQNSKPQANRQVPRGEAIRMPNKQNENTPKSEPKPRHKKRKNKKNKKQVVLADARTQRKRRRFFATIGAIVVVVFGMVFSMSVLFKVDSITVEGESIYENEQILAAFNVKEGSNLFLFDKEAQAASIQTALPYIEEINIVRRLPNKIILQITPAVEKYYASSVSGWVVLSETLRVLSISPSEPENVPYIVGAEIVEPVLGMDIAMEDETKLNVLKLLQKTLQEAELSPITRIYLEDSLNISFVFDNRIRVIIGTVNEIEEKVDWAKYLITPSGEESLAETEKGTLDVSSRNSDGRIEGVWRAGSF